MRIYRCHFCNQAIPPGTGLMYVKKDGTVLRYCSRRCFVSAERYKRNPKRQAWIRKARKVGAR